jgi:hypothetical protein
VSVVHVLLIGDGDAVSLARFEGCSAREEGTGVRRRLLGLARRTGEGVCEDEEPRWGPLARGWPRQAPVIDAVENGVLVPPVSISSAGPSRIPQRGCENPR